MRVAECHPDRPEKARRMCTACYQTERRAARGIVPRTKTPVEVRFERRVDRSAGPDACHIWPGAVGQFGFPVISLTKTTTTPCRRLAWQMAHGPVPARRWVTSTCDEKRCVNPRHLVLRAHHDDALRFWENVEKADGDACWEWTGAKDRAGYGKLKIWAIRAPVRANRFSWELHFGAINDSKMFVCHRCDNPKCVRPDHLFLGSAADNHDDMVAKGRISKGERHRAIMLYVRIKMKAMNRFTGGTRRRASPDRRPDSDG